ncbi:phosphodiester glycosidase family protein [Rufibacter roseolus]|uniref:phosphodiester glycosidase family protein n=1 Tax=Rufibacter roseolus TaxID=2817375 RepID=UPI001B30C27D|nr:phosphodiester glycosidase family protein [Rufibacter roseolus]
MNSKTTRLTFFPFLAFFFISFVAMQCPLGQGDERKGHNLVQEKPKQDPFQSLVDKYSKLKELNEKLTLDRQEESEKVLKDKEELKLKESNKLKLGSELKNLEDSLKRKEFKRLESEIAPLKDGIVKRVKRVDDLINGQAINDSNLRICIKDIQSSTKALVGGKRLMIKGVPYTIYIADLNVDMIRLHLKDKDNKNFFSLGTVKSYLQANHIDPLMITNAGMFTPKYEPEGLYVEDSEEKFELDTLANKPNANFYLQPNGVFYVDAQGKAFIKTTKEYRELNKAQKISPIIATQSGPMLLVEGVPHASFKEGSKNLNIRNGVGIIDERKVVFAATQGEVNFYDFAMFFKDIFASQNALFLDGAISQMYVAGVGEQAIGGHFGPMLSVARKKANPQGPVQKEPFKKEEVINRPPKATVPKANESSNSMKK